MNIEIQKKIKERQNKKQRQTMKGQASTEYPMMMIIALILIALAFVVILAIGGKTAKSGTMQAELLSAEASTTGNTLSIATNLPLTLTGSITGNVIGPNLSSVTIDNVNSGPYNVSGGFEYVFSTGSTGSNLVGNSITGITITSGTKVISLVPASGKNVAVTSGTAPFTITNIGS